MASRIEFLRDLRKMTQAQLATAANTTPSQIGKLERGERRLTADWQQRLARALDCAVSDLIEPLGEPDTAPISVPIEWHVGSRFTENTLFGPAPRVPALPGLVRAHECAAARVIDDSCDRLYPENSLLIVRRSPFVPRWRVGQKVLFARRDPRETLVGVLDRGATGDIVAHLRTTSRDLPAAVTLQTAAGAADPLARFGVHDRFVGREDDGAREIAFEPQPNDPAILLGLIVMAITPE